MASFVADILTRPIGLLVGHVDFTNLFVPLRGGDYPTLAAARAAGAATLNYGVFVQSVVDFLLVAGAVFLLVRQVNRLRPAPAPAAPATKECAFCLSVIPIKAARCAHCTSDLRET